MGGGAKEGQLLNPEALRLQKLVTETGLTEVVHFLPSQTQAQMPYYYSAADVTVMSSHYESFGMAALESQACGTPVVASRVGGLPYVVQDKVSGLLVPDDDSQALATALTQLLADTQLDQRLGQQAMLRAEQFTWRAIANQITQVYEDVTAPMLQELPATEALLSR